MVGYSNPFLCNAAFTSDERRLDVVEKLIDKANCGACCGGSPSVVTWLYEAAVAFITAQARYPFPQCRQAVCHAPPHKPAQYYIAIIQAAKIVHQLRQMVEVFFPAFRCGLIPGLEQLEKIINRSIGCAVQDL